MPGHSHTCMLVIMKTHTAPVLPLHNLYKRRKINKKNIIGKRGGHSLHTNPARGHFK